MNPSFTEMGKKTSKEVMRYIEWYLGMYRGKSPTIRTMASALGFTSYDPIQTALKRLERDGYITLNPTRGRYGTLNIKLTAKRYDFDT
jgi:SOS-response transcriptional repressor LexA